MIGSSATGPVGDDGGGGGSGGRTCTATIVSAIAGRSAAQPPDPVAGVVAELVGVLYGVVTAGIGLGAAQDIPFG